MLNDHKYRIGFIEFIILFYVTERLDPYWDFKSSIFCDQIYLWDIVVSSFALPKIKYFLPLKEKSNLGGEENCFIEETPVQDIIEDSFKRNNVAKEIATLLKGTNNSKSFAIGILGEYGSGKTSFINLIKKNLDSAVIVDFNPWTSENAPNIQKDFFDLLANHISKSDPRLSNLILSYSRTLRDVDRRAEGFFKTINLFSSLFYDNNSKDDYNKINLSLKCSTKKIVVTIDDMDRLSSDEIIEVLKLIRNTASFANVFFIVAYDKLYIQEAIRKLNSVAVTSYLDKIIQLEIPLPKREEEDLLNLLVFHFEKVVNTQELNILTSEIIPNGFKNSYAGSFKTVFRNSRDVLKFINSFIIPYRLLKDEVLFEDIFVLELLKFRFPLVYDQLHTNTDRIITRKPLRLNHNETYELITFKSGDETKTRFISDLDGDYSSEDKNLIDGLLISLFSGSNTAKNSIRYPMYFERYFRFRVGNEISEKQFKLAFDCGLKEMKTYIDYCTDRNLHKQILSRLLQQSTSTKTEFENLISCIFYLGPKYIEYRGRTSFPDNDLIDLLWDYNGNIVGKFYKSDAAEYAHFLNSLFKSANLPYTFQNQLIYTIKEGDRNIGLSNDTLVSFQIEYLVSSINSNGFTPDGLWLFWGIREYYTTSGPKPGIVYKHWKFEPSVIEVIKKALQENDPTLFLAESIALDNRSGLKSIHSQILSIFESKDGLRELVKNSPFITEEVRTEYLDFYEECKSNGFKQYIDFDFKTILKPEKIGV